MSACTRFAVLGLVLERPAHPYELSVRFDERMGRSWGMHRAQIYQTVYKLEEDGLIERGARDLSSLPTAHNVFRATEHGRQAFESWLLENGASTERPRPPRDGLHVKLAFCQPHHAGQLLALVTDREESVLRTINQCAGTCAARDGDGAEPWHEIACELIADGTIAALQAELRWLRRVRTTIVEHTALSAQEGRSPATRQGWPGRPEPGHLGYAGDPLETS